MEPDLGNYIRNIRAGQPVANIQGTQVPVIGKHGPSVIAPNDMSREQVYEYLQNNPPQPPQVSSSIHPELQRMASQLKSGEAANKKIVSDAQRRKAAQAVRRNVPGR